MSRLADYFVVVGYDHEKDRSGTSSGKILQRFPEKDWDDCPFMQGLPLFCQPMGWALSSQRQQPSFYVAVLTDMDGDRHYCAVFTFHELVAMTPCKPDDEEDEQEGSIVQHSSMFAPKCLVLVSRHDYFEAFRNCLGIIYTVHLENLPVKIETLIGNILGCVQVPPAGGPQVRFSIGAGDRQALQPPLSATLPISQNSVAILFEQLGINNALTVFCAALTDHKVLFYSESCSRLCDACRAISVLHYPLKYTYVYIPILPMSLLEVLNSPTPFIAGVHAKLKDDIADLLDVIVVDLDGGSVKIPECVTVPNITDTILNRVKKALTMILTPELLCADYAFTSSPQKLAPVSQRDKELRAVFIRMFAELFSGYRSSLAVVRIHPTPFITFHKAHFLAKSGSVEERDFVLRVIDGMAFSCFVAERGPPYRVCDIFDEVSATIQEQLQEEQNDPARMMENIRELAHHLQLNECPNQQPYVAKLPKPTEGAYTRIHQPLFPALDNKVIQDIINEGLYNNKKLNSVRPQQVRIVPTCMSFYPWSVQRAVENNARRLEVLRNCVGFIFENKISDARIIFPAVLRALKTGMARLALTQELGENIRSNRAMLEHQQFDLIVKLLNCALQPDETSLDEHGVAAAILPLATAFCRKLCTGVIQFAYTCIQEHAVWSSHQFWEQAFYQDVQGQIKQLYLPMYEEHMLMNRSTESATVETADSNDSNSATLVRPKKIGPLEIAAEQLRVWPTLTDEQQREMINNEESTVYSQAIHYAYRMVYMRVPLDVSRSLKNMAVDENGSTVTASVAESDSLDAESGFDETEQTDVAAVVTKFVSRFVDKVCSDGGVTQEHIKALHQMIPGVVAMHIETLEAVNRESKRLPPVQKPKIMKPALLPGEEIVMADLRVYLLADGREDISGGVTSGPSILPAEGGIFLTTYRIVFKGTPCDPFVSEQTVIRGFPVSSLTKEKKISVQLYIPHLDQGLTEGLQLRSNVFQLLRIAFDEEVGSENIETFRKLVNKVRNPPSVFETFAFTGYAIHASTQMHKGKEKNASLRQFAKRTLLKTARKAGLKKQSRSKSKYSLTSPPSTRRSHSPHSSDSESEYAGSVHNDDLSVIDENELVPAYSSDPKNVERLMEQCAYQDYQRLGLGSVTGIGQRGARSEPFRVSTVNSTYQVCRSYPGLLVVPQSVSDDSIRKFSRCHRQSRFPVISWRHPRSRALLLRASGFHSRGLMGMLRHNSAASHQSGEASSSIEQEKYFMLLVAATPSSHRTSTLLTTSNSDSLSSIDSLIKVDVGGESSLNIPQPSPTPGTRRLQTSLDARPDGVDKRISAPPGSMVNTRTKNASNVGRMGSLRVPSPNLGRSSHSSSNGGAADHGDLINNSIKRLQQVSLYVLGEKAQMKGIKVESFPKCDFIPVDFYEVRQVKASFKKLMRACTPSTSPGGADSSFHKEVEDSEWLLQVRSVLQLAGAVVDLLDVQGSSVMICLEDGWDITTQVVSVAQVMLDPYYRTMEGFKALIEKEWQGFGHRFSHRNNQTSATQTSGFAPIFLQFLDIVHQVHHQFPLSFEFSQYYLRFLAYHCVSNRFRTFMLDSELERVEAGWLLEGSRRASFGSETRSEDGSSAGDHHHSKTIHLPLHSDFRESSVESKMTSGACVWDYIDKQSKLSPIFFNVYYAVEEQEPVLRPYSNVSNLKIWDFYLSEDMCRGSPYDLDLKEVDGQGEELEAEAMGISKRRVINARYHNIFQQQPHVFWSKIQEIHRLEGDLGLKPSPWRAVWDRLECPGREQFHRQVCITDPCQVSMSTQQVRIHGRTFHKRATLEIIVKGKIQGEASRMFSQPHRFEKHTYTTPTYCNHCQQVLWGLSKTGLRCVDCGYNCHDKCQASVPKNCQKLRAVGDAGVTTPNLQGNGGATVAANTAVSSPDTFDQYKTSSREHRTHEGHLWKQGALFKQWKQRWFVLDSMKHQLRYHEALNDPHHRGLIDLAEVESVSLVKSIPGAPKKAEENSFLEIRTVRRTYNFMATNSKAAIEWVDKLQGCIQRE